MLANIPKSMGNKSQLFTALEGLELDLQVVSVDLSKLVDFSLSIVNQLQELVLYLQEVQSKQELT